MRRVQHIMGTAISLELVDDRPAAQLTRLADGVFAWLSTVDARFSTYTVDSVVSRLDRGELTPAECDEDVRHVLDACARLKVATGGYFDAYATGRLDPSAYVKGWSVQVASDRLLAEGVGNHCLNAGGDVRVHGHPEPGQPWRIGLRHPTETDQVFRVLAGTDLAVATSGTYERGQHIVDPYTGRPATDLCSVTVVGEDLGLADAYSTAALAMGLAGLDWLATADLASIAVTTDGRVFRTAGLPVE